MQATNSPKGPVTTLEMWRWSGPRGPVPFASWEAPPHPWKAGETPRRGSSGFYPSQIGWEAEPFPPFGWWT